eukprot:891877-Pleurochrysis_carterae.AAC.4
MPHVRERYFRSLVRGRVWGVFLQEQRAIAFQLVSAHTAASAHSSTYLAMTRRCRLGEGDWLVRTDLALWQTLADWNIARGCVYNIIPAVCDLARVPHPLIDTRIRH